MQFNDFRSMIDRLARDVPAEFRGGVVAIEVSPKTVPHPLRGDVYTLGECIPLEWSGSGADLQSRIVLYHGSFAALARLGDFEWREEAWETLAHELRHHLEWRANAGALEAYDWAAEENFNRHEGQPFDPVFYRSGERLVEGVYKVDDDVFIERDEWNGRGEGLDIVWHGRHYRVPIARSSRAQPMFLSLEGLAEPPPGEAVVVLRRKASLLDLFRRTALPLQQTVAVEPLDG
ncbi:MAG TPA: metallopeptidase family protein [Gemmatimonadales bacterium]|nr:metallopeptidase family protein [Gemmatimonadales bacterium]